MQPVFDAVVTNAVRSCGALHSAAVRLEGGLLHLVSHHNWSPEGLATAHRLFPMPLTRDHVTAHAVREARTIHLHHMQDDPTVAASARAVLAIAQGYQTLLVVPMRRDHQAIGAIIVAKVEGPFSESQIALLQTFADQAVIAIENVRLFKELEVRNRDLTETLEQQTATGEILRVISSSPTDVQPVLDAVTRERRAALRGRVLPGLHGTTAGAHPLRGRGGPRRARSLEAVRNARSHGPPTGAPRARRAPSCDAGVAQISDVHCRSGATRSPTVADAMNFRSRLGVPMIAAKVDRSGRSRSRGPQPGVFPDRQVELPPDLRRPGRDRHRERPAVHRAGRAQP